MADRDQVLTDHRRKGTVLVPPMLAALGDPEDASWVRRILPEVVWLSVVHRSAGDQQAVGLLSRLAGAARLTGSDRSQRAFATVTAFQDLSGSDWEAVERTAGDGISELKAHLRPLVALYPKICFSALWGEAPDVAEGDLERMKTVVGELFVRSNRFAMMAQATLVWLHFDAGCLKAVEGTALESFPAIRGT